MLVAVFSISMLAACSSSSDEPSYSDKAFNLIHTSKGTWYAVFWIPELEMYLLRKLQWLEYREDVDIRKAYLYGRYGKKRKPL